MRPPALPRVFLRERGRSLARGEERGRHGRHGEAEHRRALDEAGAVALAGEEVVDDRVLRGRVPRRARPRSACGSLDPCLGSLLMGVGAKLDVRWYAGVGLAAHCGAPSEGVMTEPGAIVKQSKSTLPERYRRARCESAASRSSATRAPSTTTAHLLNGDPRVPVPLDAGGRVAAVGARGARSRRARSTSPLHTRFARTRETLTLLLGRRPDVPVAIEPAFDDVDVGDLRGPGRRRPIATGARCTGPSEAVPGRREPARRARRATPTAARACSPAATRAACCSSCTTCRSASCATPCCAPIRSAGPVRTVANLERLSVGEAQLGGRARRHAAQARAAFRRSDSGASATAVLAADDGHRMPVVVARDHHCCR